ncbi:hypothetical protein IF1G_02830 [Cordyceps javanica]|uniref:Uncharacterized protein n=1 Tax=Cordyceps javanica TaxID=43265 RepID=A0A545VAK0_9HYPO|nr:hypothetical protein IF1G_02830 [Cordyceps javanica]
MMLPSFGYPLSSAFRARGGWDDVSFLLKKCRWLGARAQGEIGPKRRRPFEYEREEGREGEGHKDKCQISCPSKNGRIHETANAYAANAYAAWLINWFLVLSHIVPVCPTRIYLLHERATLSFRFSLTVIACNLPNDTRALAIAQQFALGLGSFF